MTLFELLVVMVIMGILMTIAGLSFTGMRARYTLEKQVKELYVELMNTRLRAIQRSRIQYVSLTGLTTCNFYEDGPAPDGDGRYTVGLDANDVLIKSYALQPAYSMVLSNPSMTLIAFSAKGLVDPGQTGYIRLDPTVGGEFDCLVIDQIKTSLGRWNGAAQCDIR